ncbi:hypothetical protein HG536_0D02100 [Torulaspora globosa]|uniref:Uncharacterized protein n=1 Tax=Torulaspora globosa TaxID=48254 RepID=A0A7G3ZGQ2_9SACH|nr:uncharacterized protein HG536_0D02100 [Torulaspora globosa]QLL32688.1 hypothetical protein HG536_0D02100 [Torulaspora globosa]
MGYDMALMERASPMLFSRERYEEYPMEYAELKHYLTSNGIEDFPKRQSKPYTHVDYLDYLLYRDDETGSTIDLNKKLLCEYALYQVQSQKRSEVGSITMAKLMSLEPRSLEWYDCLTTLLETTNATNLDIPLLQGSDGSGTSSPGKGQEKSEGVNRSNTIIKKNRELQELTSFVLSNAIKKGIELRPVNMDNPLEFLKNAIETIIASSSQPRKEDSDPQMDSLETAFKDLQLAHSFLTKQFENDRNEYLQNIEILQRTNKELQQKLLDYHSDLSQVENRLQETERELEENNKRASQPQRKSFGITSPLFSGDAWNEPSPGSAKSFNSTNAHSITIMRTEFKRLLVESQRRYEKELQEERDARLRLEKELESLRRRSR